MASVASALIGDGGGKLLDGAAHIINAIKGHNPEDAEKLQELVTKHQDTIIAAQVTLAQQQSEENIKLNQIASDNVKADAGSERFWQFGARPGVIWCGILIFIINYGLLAFLQKWGFKPVEMPTMFWEAWGIVTTGVVMTRSADKALPTILGGKGGTISLPGVKVDSKGD